MIIAIIGDDSGCYDAENLGRYRVLEYLSERRERYSA